MALYKKETDLTGLIGRIETFPEEDIKNDLTRFLPLNSRGLVGGIKKLILVKLKSQKTG